MKTEDAKLIADAVHATLEHEATSGMFMVLLNEQNDDVIYAGFGAVAADAATAFALLRAVSDLCNKLPKEEREKLTVRLDEYDMPLHPKDKN